MQVVAVDVPWNDDAHECETGCVILETHVNYQNQWRPIQWEGQTCEVVWVHDSQLCRWMVGPPWEAELVVKSPSEAEWESQHLNAEQAVEVNSVPVDVEALVQVGYAH